MENSIYIEKTEDSPCIIIDKEKGVFEITGKSLPENANKVYNPVIEWFEEYAKNPNPATELKLQLEYFNSSSARKLFEIFMVFEQMYSQKHKVKIIWLYHKDDEVMGNRGKELKEAVIAPFEIKEDETKNNL